MRSVSFVTLFLSFVFVQIAFSSLERKVDIYKNIRCLVCQGQSLNDSSSDFAKDLKQVIQKKIMEKKTNKEIYEYLTDRYGDWILFNPPLKKSTILLWAIPGLFFFLGAILLIKKTQLTTLNRDN